MSFDAKKCTDFHEDRHLCLHAESVILLQYTEMCVCVCVLGAGIAVLTESFDSRLADAGNRLVRQLGRYLR